MSERTGFVLRHGVGAGAVFAVLVLLMLFYSTVSGAVERAQERRSEAADNVRLSRAAGAVPDAAQLPSLTSAAR